MKPKTREVYGHFVKSDQSGISKLYADVAHRAFLVRIGLEVCQAIIFSIWLGPVWAIAWFAAISFHEFVMVPWVTKRFIAPHAFTNQRLATANGAGLALFGAVVHAAGWVPTWLTAGADFSYFGAFWLAGALIHAHTYYSAYRSVYLACMAPAAVACLTMPFIVSGVSIVTLLMTLATAQILAAFFVAFIHAQAYMTSASNLQKKWRAAEDASRAKSQFLATMSHELRTPLNAVIGYAELLDETMDEEGRRTESEHAQRIHRSARALLGLINEVLDFSKLEAGKAQVNAHDVDLQRLTDEVLETTRVLAEQNGNTLTASVSFGSEKAWLDGGKLRQCLLNLVSNACKFTENGSITVEAKLENEVLTFVVTDTGCGISAAEQSKLFQPFVQADSSLTRKHSGTGLALVITKRLAELMGGGIAMESTPGAGSVFTLTVAAPAAQPALAEAA